MKERDFWEETFASADGEFLIDESMFNPNFLSIIGDVKGKRILDLGCGTGELSLLLAKRGAFVVGIDGAANAISVSTRRAKANDLAQNTQFIEGDLRELHSIVDTKFDIIVGKFVLHHIEPIDALFDSMNKVLTVGGQGVFYENSSDNKILMWARTNLVGRFGIPKFGDDDEVPLSRKETDLAKRSFDVEIVFPSFVFFGLFGAYMLRSPMIPRFIANLPLRLDNLLFRVFPAVRCYSYHKIVHLTKRCSIQN